jgi:acetate kinase
MSATPTSSPTRTASTSASATTNPTTQTAVLSVNAGSSSLKFAVYPCNAAAMASNTDLSGLDVIGSAGLSGLAEGLEPGGNAVIAIKLPAGKSVKRALTVGADESPFGAALRAVTQAVQQDGGMQLLAVAHRIVHGGDRYASSVVITDEVLAYLESLNPLAPLHQPHNVAGVKAFMLACPDLPQVACFDTAFHATTSPIEQHFGLPESFYAEGVRRYGFHGLSYRYVSEQLATITPAARQRMLLAHLGNGASLCAVRDGRSVATTMGFSALEGLMMGTRSGSIDPGVLLHLLRQGWDGDRIEKLLYKQSGLLGVSGISADMRTLRASSESGAERAIALFTHRVLRECGALTALLGGIDLIGFTGGIGEHDTALRADVCEALAFLGIRLDPAANLAADGNSIVPIHAADSRVEIWVVPTDEGRIAARDALALRAAAPASQR